MDNSEFDSITAFDTLYTTNHLQMLKILLPYIQRDLQPHIAVYIKLNEFLFSLQISTLDCFSSKNAGGRDFAFFPFSS